MSFVEVTPAGELVHHSEPATGDAIRAVMPSEGFDLVRLHQHEDLFAFVDDAGHVMGLDRNPVGSCVLAELGAKPYAYCGPVVVTGWSEPDEVSELRDLTDIQQGWVARIHTSVRQVLAGEAAPFTSLRIRQALRDYAAWVTSSPIPQMRIVSIDPAAGTVVHP